MAAEQPLIRQGGGRQQGDRCRGNDPRRNDYADCANCGAGKEDTPLDTNCWSKRIRRMGKITHFFR